MDRPRILIVEDEGIVALQLRTSLEQRGYAVAGVFATGEEALASVEAAAPDLVLMDMKLQGALDGIQTASQLRERYGLPVVFLTAHSEESTIERAKRAEPYGYILKPFSVHELVIAIEVAHHKHGVDREKELLTKELQAALQKVKQLSGLLPICASCKRIRDDEGDWVQLERYIREHSEAEFSHGICEDCARRIYPDCRTEEGSDGA
jgi:CheY-like chemotaxis protein